MVVINTGLIRNKCEAYLTWPYLNSDLWNQQREELSLFTFDTLMLTIYMASSGYETIDLVIIGLNLVVSAENRITIVHTYTSDTTEKLVVLEISKDMTSSGREAYNHEFGIKVHFSSVLDHQTGSVCVYTSPSLTGDYRTLINHLLEYYLNLEDYCSFKNIGNLTHRINDCKHVLTRITLLLYKRILVLITVFEIPLYG